MPTNRAERYLLNDTNREVAYHSRFLLARSPLGPTQVLKL